MAGLGRRIGTGAALLLVVPVCSVGCSQPTEGIERGRPWVEAVGPGTELRIRSKAGEKVRTRKRLTVTEQLPTGDKATSSIDECYVQEVQATDEQGGPVQVLRQWERYQTRVEKPGAAPVTETGPLEGSEVELTQRVSGVTARVVSGKADAGQLAGMLISGFEQLLLPTKPVHSGDRWEVDTTASEGMSGLFRALGLESQKSVVQCVLVASGYQFDGTVDPLTGVEVPLKDWEGEDKPKPVPPDAPAVAGNAAPEAGKNPDARIAVDWTITGSVLGGTPMVFRLSGEFTFNMQESMVTKLQLAGGKVTPLGTVQQQIAMEVTREKVAGWWG